LIAATDSIKARKALAEIELDMNRIDEAQSLADAVLAANGKDLDGKYLKGRVALARRQLREAKGLFAEVVRQDATMARARLYNGLTDVLLGQAEAGIKEVAEAVRLEPRDVRARLLLGELYLRAGAAAAAGQQAEEILRRNPYDVRAAVLYADSFLLRKEWGKAERIYQAMMRRMPKSPVGYMKMGLAKRLQGRASDAARYFGQAVEKNPNDLALVNEYVLALAAAGDFRTASRLVERWKASAPNNAFVWEMAARLSLARGARDEAEQAFLKATALAPDSARPYYELGVLYAGQRKLPQAEARLRKAVEKEGRNVAARVLLGVVLNAQGKIDEANAEYRRVLELSPKNVTAANNLASNLADHGGNLDEALKFAQIAREAAPEEANVADTLGWIYFKKGLYDTAGSLIGEAASRLTRDPAVRYHRGMVLLKKGHTREGKAELEAALAAGQDFPGIEEARRVLASAR